MKSRLRQENGFAKICTSRMLGLPSFGNGFRSYECPLVMGPSLVFICFDIVQSTPGVAGAVLQTAL